MDGKNEKDANGRQRERLGSGCDCWEKMNKVVADKGMKLSDEGVGIRMIGNEMAVVYGIPLERMDGKKPLRTDPKCLEITHCPFCGNKF